MKYEHRNNIYTLSNFKVLRHYLKHLNLFIYIYNSYKKQKIRKNFFHNIRNVLMCKKNTHKNYYSLGKLNIIMKNCLSNKRVTIH